MEATTTQSGREYRKVGEIVLAIALVAFIGGSSAMPARADENGYGHDVQNQGDRNAQYQGDRGAQYQGDRDEQHRRGQSYGYYDAPGYVYAPPPVYYAPPPQPPVIDLVFPLNFR